VAVSKDTRGAAVLGIGDLAELTGMPVRTVRFYCDAGILEPQRSAGGHRGFSPSAVDQLGLVRRLRSLGLGLPAIAHVLAGDRSVAEVVAAERNALDAELAALSRVDITQFTGFLQAFIADLLAGHALAGAASPVFRTCGFLGFFGAAGWRCYRKYLIGRVAAVFRWTRG
jgi:DNA-binding transcriptional MerR regulator